MNKLRHTNTVQLVTLLARRASYNGEWRVRTKFADQHYDARNGKISIQQLIEYAELTKTRWQVHEPQTEFKIEVHQ